MVCLLTMLSPDVAKLTVENYLKSGDDTLNNHQLLIDLIFNLLEVDSTYFEAKVY